MGIGSRSLAPLLAAMCVHACINTSAYSNVDLGGSVIILSRAEAPADGNHTIQVGVALRRDDGSPVAGLTVAVNAATCAVQQTGEVSDSNGLVAATVRSGVVTHCTVQVKVSQGEFAWVLPQSPVLVFSPLSTVATHLDFLPVPAARAGFPFSVTVLALDAQGAADPNFAGTVRLMSDDPNAQLPAPYTMMVNDHGTHTFTGVVLQRAGRTLLSSVTDANGIGMGVNLGSAQTPLTVAGGVATALAFANVPSQALAGQAVTAQLVALDAFGNRAEGYTSNVWVSSDDTGAVESMAVFDENALGTFTQTLFHSGVHTLQARDDSPLPLAARSAPVSVLPGRATMLALDVPAHASATLPLPVTVRAADPYGNTDPNFVGAVHLTSTDGAGSLPADYPFSAPDAGSHLFSTGVRFFTTGNQSLTASAPGVASATATLEVFNVLSIASGNSAGHACAILSDHTVKCWGANSQGQLGLGDTVDRGGDVSTLGAELPVVDVGNEHFALSLALSATSTCAVLEDHSVKCWGLNNSGQLGVGDTRNRGYSPGQMGDVLPASAMDTPAVSVSVSDGDTYAVGTQGTVQSWGYGYQCLQLGNNSCGTNLPLDVPLPSNTAVQIESGVWTAVVRMASGNLFGWGDGWAGQTGIGHLAKNPTTSPVQLGTGRTALSLASQTYSYCALLDDHTVKCWGYAFYGALGVGDTSNRGNNNDMGDALPALQLGTGRTARVVTGLGLGACAILDTGAVKCWGYNANGALGIGDTQDRGDTPGSMGDALPTVDLGTGRTARQIAGGGNFVCALLDNNLVKCWGDNSAGALGVGDLRDRGDRADSLGDALPYAQLW